MVKPLSFKGDKKPKKRKRTDAERDAGAGADGSSSSALKQVRKAQDAAAQDADGDGDDDTWVSAEAVSDVSGPVMIVLPTDTPSALACDPAGKVFTIPIENIVDGNPVTAEPHDVRQVWVANRIAGTEHFRFKGHHGRYLSCDKAGVLAATNEAISPLESFNVIATSDTPGTFQIQSLRETLISVKPSTSSSAPVQVRGDADTISFNTTLRIRMQARFKPRLKASKEEKALAKISRRELEDAVGRRLDEDEVRLLKRARKEGNYHETLLDVKVKSKHDKFS